MPVSEKLEPAYLNPFVDVGINVPKRCVIEFSRYEFLQVDTVVAV